MELANWTVLRIVTTSHRHSKKYEFLNLNEEHKGIHNSFILSKSKYNTGREGQRKAAASRLGLSVWSTTLTTVKTYLITDVITGCNGFADNTNLFMLLELPFLVYFTNRNLLSQFVYIYNHVLVNWFMYKENLDVVLVKNFVRDSNLSLELLFLKSQIKLQLVSVIKRKK